MTFRTDAAAKKELVLEHLDTGALLADASGAITYATPTVGRLLGIEKEALEGEGAARAIEASLVRLHARHLDGRPFQLGAMPLFEALRTRATVRAEWMVISRKPLGEQLILEMTATPFWEDQPGGALAGVVQTLADRTEAATRMRELIATNDELRQKQGRQVQRLRSEALGQLAVAAAHALNNQLNVMRLRLTLLRRGQNPAHLDALERSVKSISEVVAHIQEFSAARPEETLTEVSLDELAREALAVARPGLAIGGQPLRVTSRLDPTGRVRVDQAFVRGLLVHLLLAARDRMHAGGELGLASARRGDSAELRIGFSGIFSAAELAALFDPLRKTGTPQFSLLLASACNQVQRWGGALTGETHEGGAAFVLHLPLVAATAELRTQPRAEAPSRSKRARRVLVVDDDVDNARLLQTVLEVEGYRAVVAYSGKQALGLWDSEGFDAALLDVLMPDMTGWELAREIRRSPRTFVAMVTGAEVRGQSRGNLAMVDAVFTKPVDPRALGEFLAHEERPAG